MWKLLPLSLKLTLPLVLMQVLVIGLGVVWLSNYLEKARVGQLEVLLDSQTDAIEDAVVVDRGAIRFDARSELVREMFHDPIYYYVLLSSTGELIDESMGPSKNVRDLFKEKIGKSHQMTSHFAKSKIIDDEWHFQRENIDPINLPHKDLEDLPRSAWHGEGAVLYSAINTGPALREISVVKRALVIGALIFIMLTSLGTSIIVSHTTSNLKVFSRSIAAIRPNSPEWDVHLQPRSAEERLLFSSFHTMITSIKRSSDAQKLFIANASHELKTPISAILLTLEVMLTRKRHVEEYEQTGKEILKSVKVLRRLSSALLDLAKLENMDSLPLDKVNLNDLMEDLIGRWLPMALDKGVSLRLETVLVQRDIVTNRDSFEVALGNFIDNAIKYTPENGLIILRVAPSNDGKFWQLSIKDNGIGMDEITLSRLGEVFFRANEARTEDLSYGLGYAQAEKIVLRLGGEIKVTSQLNQGTEITLAWPV